MKTWCGNRKGVFINHNERAQILLCPFILRILVKYVVKDWRCGKGRSIDVEQTTGSLHADLMTSVTSRQKGAFSYGRLGST